MLAQKTRLADDFGRKEKLAALELKMCVARSSWERICAMSHARLG